MLRATLSSGKVVTLRTITVREQINADKCANGDLSMLAYYRVGAAIAKIEDSENVREYQPAANDLDLDARINDLGSSQDFNELLQVFNDHLAPKKVDVKNI